MAKPLQSTGAREAGGAADAPTARSFAKRAAGVVPENADWKPMVESGAPMTGLKHRPKGLGVGILAPGRPQVWRRAAAAARTSARPSQRSTESGAKMTMTRPLGRCF